MHRGETRLAGDSERTTSASSSRRLPVPRLLLFDPREKHTVLSSTVLPALSSSLALRTPSERVLRPGEACLISSGEGREGETNKGCKDVRRRVQRVRAHEPVTEWLQEESSEPGEWRAGSERDRAK